MRILVLTLFLVSVNLSIQAKFKNTLNYSQAGDVFELIVGLGNEIGSSKDGTLKSYWIKSFGMSKEEKSHIEDFNIIRNKYKKKFGPFDQFSLAFYRSNSVNDALTKLKKVLKKNELETIVKSLRVLRKNAVSIIGQSSTFKGKIAQMEKKYKRMGLFKAHSDVFRFFGYKKQFQTKVFFQWWPENKPFEVRYEQNIVFIKMNPLLDIEKLLPPHQISRMMAKALFSTMTDNQLSSFNKTINSRCKLDEVKKSLFVAMGPMNFEAKVQKKKFDPQSFKFTSKREKLLSLLFFDLYERQSKNREKFFGSFVNKVADLCALTN